MLLYNNIMPAQHMKAPEQAREDTSPAKIYYIISIYIYIQQYIVNYVVRDVKSAVMMPNGLGEKSRWVQKTGRHFFGIKSG